MPEGIAPDAWELAGKAMGWPDINRDLLRRRVANAIMAVRQSRPSRPDHEALIERLIQKRIDAIYDANGDYEPDTNVTNLPDWAETVVEELGYLLDDVRAALSSLQPPAPAPLEQKETDNG